MEKIDLSNVDMRQLQAVLTPRLTKYVPYNPTPKQAAFLLMNNTKEVLYGGAAGGGKALAVSTPILTSAGWKTMGTIAVGDKVLDECGEYCNVIAVSGVQYDHVVYRVWFDNRTYIDADAEHLWTLAQYQNRPVSKTMTTQEIVDTMGNRTNHAVSVTKPLVGTKQDLPIPPYTLGVWLGDGSKNCGDCAAQDKAIYDEVRKDGFEPYEKPHKVHVIPGLYPLLNKAHLLGNKRIPSEYLLASYEQRLALLQGLMDTDGNASSDKGYCSICMTNKDLMRQIEFLVRSMGIKVSLTESIATCTQTGAKMPKFNLKWSCSEAMFRLPYKLARQKRANFRGTQKLHYIKKVEEIDSVPVQCIKVDSASHLFLAGEALIPTHNSIAQLMGALQFVDIPGYSAILFRKTYADLTLPGALIDVSKQWLQPFVKTGEVKWSEKEKKYTFPSGANLNFGYLESDNDCYRYQGAEFQYIGIDECTHISPSNYRYMFSRLRKTKNLPVPLRFRATCNPGGMYGEYYYQRFFVEGEENGRIFISAGLKDNPFLDADQYKEALMELDPIEREQLLNGNWQIKASGDLLDRNWFQTVPAHEVPAAASFVRYWDLAGTDPAKRKGKNKREPDWSVGFKLAHYQGMYWIVDIVRVQKKPHDLEEIIKTTAEVDGYNCAVRMEQEPGSSGIITIDHYARNVLNGYNFSGVVSTGSKVERVRPASSAAQAGRVMISDRCRNMLPFFDEADLFPYGAHDDTIDGYSGAFNFFRSNLVKRAPTGLKKSGGSYWRKM